MECLAQLFLRERPGYFAVLGNVNRVFQTVLVVLAPLNRLEQSFLRVFSGAVWKSNNVVTFPDAAVTRIRPIL
jgi:hypothetical protein